MTAATTPRSSDVDHVAVGFLDISGFTALTAVHGDLAAADLSEELAAMVATALHGAARLVKTLGDAVLFTAPTPQAALAAVRDILGRWADAPSRRPILHGGIHYGPVVLRNNDVYGTTVNIAARIAAAAHTDQILFTESIAAAAKTEGLPVVHLGRRRLRNVTDPVEVYALDGLDCLCRDVDPVCRMSVPESGAHTLDHRGVAYRFCSRECADRFTCDPARYVTAVDCVADESPAGIS